jgi:hypothetical protein
MGGVDEKLIPIKATGGRYPNIRKTKKDGGSLEKN